MGAAAHHHDSVIGSGGGGGGGSSATGGPSSSVTRRNKPGGGEALKKEKFKQVDAWHEIPVLLDAYKARKEPIPFGMSEKIWDLDSYKKDYKNFMSEFERI